MPSNTATTLTAAVGAAVRQAGSSVLSFEQGAGFKGEPTAIFSLGLSAGVAEARTLRLELSEPLDFGKPELLPGMTEYLREQAQRLRNPR